MRLSLQTLAATCFAASLAFVTAARPAQTPAPAAPTTPRDSAPSDWPDGSGKAEFLQICTNCHAPDTVLGKNLDADGWSDILNKMIQFGAQASDDQFGNIYTYLTTNFGPAPDKVNINSANVMNLRSWLNIPADQARAIVKYRMQNGAFQSLDNLKKVPGIDATYLDSIQSKLSFDAAPPAPASGH